jgi:hypothetical protein
VGVGVGMSIVGVAWRGMCRRRSMAISGRRASVHMVMHGAWAGRIVGVGVGMSIGV